MSGRESVLDFVTVLLLLLLLAVSGLARQWVLYPCRVSEWRYAFGGENSEERQALHKARRQKRGVEEKHRFETAELKRKLSAQLRTHQERIRLLEGDREALLRPGWGSRVSGGSLGLLRLHEHVLISVKVAPEGEQDDTDVEWKLDLAGLEVDRPVYESQFIYLHLADAKRNRRTATFSREHFQGPTVEAFADLIHNQALTEASRLAKQKGQLEANSEQLRQAKAKRTQVEEEGRRRQAELYQAQSADEAGLSSCCLSGLEDGVFAVQA
ncbi:hypothetical protein [Streptomyces sp. B6B3]|uniref:hypothetical protein n=1 Tax=Streptomyces sp. B6B3 TaxID=3153570 RepID=UPI00325E5779